MPQIANSDPAAAGVIHWSGNGTPYIKGPNGMFLLDGTPLTLNDLVNKYGYGTSGASVDPALLTIPPDWKTSPGYIAAFGAPWSPGATGPGGANAFSRDAGASGPGAPHPYGMGPDSGYGTGSLPGGYLGELSRTYGSQPTLPPSTPPAAPTFADTRGTNINRSSLPLAPPPGGAVPGVMSSSPYGGVVAPTPGTIANNPTVNTTFGPDGGSNPQGSEYGGSSDYGSSGGNNGGFDWDKAFQIAAQVVAGVGQYKSNKSNRDAANRGPVLPADVQAPRAQLGAMLLQLLQTPGGLDYGETPFPLNLGETDPFAAVNKYRESSNPAFQTELQDSLDTERAKLGGQYGIRFGTDLQRGLGDTTNRITSNREANLGQLGIGAYDSFMGRRLAELGLRTDDYRKQHLGLLPLVMNYLGGQPASSPYSGGSPSGQALQTFGSILSNNSSPIYQYGNQG